MDKTRKKIRTIGTVSSVILTIIMIVMIVVAAGAFLGGAAVMILKTSVPIITL